MMDVTKMNSRRSRVLAAIIDTHIETASPVGSEALRQKAEFNFSSATIRNIMANLEKKGFLSHPYTSAGRIPTQKGYRYYVNFLMPKRKLSWRERYIIEREYKYTGTGIEDLLERTSHLLSRLTGYAGLTSLIEEEKLFLTGTSRICGLPEFKELNRLSSLLKVFEQKKPLLDIMRGLVKQAGVRVQIGSENRVREIEGCSLVASSFMRNKTPLGTLAVLGPTRMIYPRVVSIVKNLSGKLTEILEGNF